MCCTTTHTITRLNFWKQILKNVLSLWPIVLKQMKNTELFPNLGQVRTESDSAAAYSCFNHFLPLPPPSAVPPRYTAPRTASNTAQLSSASLPGHSDCRCEYSFHREWDRASGYVSGLSYVSCILQPMFQGSLYVSCRLQPMFQGSLMSHADYNQCFRALMSQFRGIYFVRIPFTWCMEI